MGSESEVKHRIISGRIHEAIISGEYSVGQRIPTEVELGEIYQVSRPTVSRALRDLEQKGLLVRRRGAGTFVTQPASKRLQPGLFGLTVPHTEGGILAPVCHEISYQVESKGHAIIFGSPGKEAIRMLPERIDAFCNQFLARGVRGVFFVPLIVPQQEMGVNEAIAGRLHDAGIPVVLLDRDIYDYPRRSRYDLIGVDNRRNGYLVTRHLLDQGCRRIEFVGIGLAASTVTARIAGYREALIEAGLTPNPDWVLQWESPSSVAAFRARILDSRPDALVCVNDDVAREVMHYLATIRVRIPEDIRVAGFDDLSFAKNLPVPLTTMRQPARHIGLVAVDAMLSRMDDPTLPARDILLDCELCVRKSCGARLRVAHA